MTKLKIIGLKRKIIKLSGTIFHFKLMCIMKTTFKSKGSFSSHFLSKVFHPPYFTSKQIHPKSSKKKKRNSINVMWLFGLQLFLRLCFITAFFSSFFFLVQPQELTLSTVNSASVHCSRSHKLHFSTIFLLKIGPTALFTHLKINSLQCFQFQFSVLAKISSI